MNQRCPNCGEFKLKKGITVRGCGWILLFGVPLTALFLVPGAIDLYGGNSDLDLLSKISLWSIVIGAVVIILSYLSPQKTFSYECENCNYKEERIV